MPKGIKGYQRGHKGFLTPEHYKIIASKNKISQLGRKLTDEDKRKISIANTGRIPWNKGLKTGRNLKHNASILRKNPSCVFLDSLRLFKDCAGIYSIINRNNGKIYIGSSLHMMARMNGHRGAVLKNKHANRYLTRAILKEPDAFEFSVMEIISDVMKLDERETFWIKFFNSNNSELGYNFAPVGGSNRGVKYGKEFGAKISAALSRRVYKKVGRDILVARGFIKSGRKRSPESVARGIATRRLKKCKMKPVIQISKEGVEISRFDSAADAAMALNGKRNGGHINSVCTGNRPIAFGFKWRHA